MSPDGRSVAFVVTRIDSDGNTYHRSIWMSDETGTRAFTTGKSDTSPRWSPDGTRLAFLRKIEDRPQVAVMPVDGGEPVVVTDFPLGASEPPEWSPDGSRLAMVGTDWVEGWAELDEEQRQRAPRRIRRRDYRGDGLGWTHDRHRAVYLVDPDGSLPAERLTNSDLHESRPTWSPDGSTIAFFSDGAERPGFQPGTDVWEAEVAGGADPREVGARGMWYSLAYRPDGVLHTLGFPGDDFPDLHLLWRFDPEPVCVAKSDRSHFAMGSAAERLLFDGDVALVPRMDSGSLQVVEIHPDGEIRVLAGDRTSVTGFDRAAGVFAYTESTVDHPGRLVAGGEVRFGEPDGEAVVPDHFVVEGPGADLDVWVYLPEGDEEVPLVLNIHGGPAAQYGWNYFDEFQVYARAGYGVVATNPRGSGGRDRDFLRAVVGKGWGEVDVEDIDAVVEAAQARHTRLSKDRLGVMGGSYGGFLTAWLIGKQPRWKVAIVERALLAWPSFNGTSDIGGWFSERYLRDDELDRDRSPLRLASEVQTPTLIVHSEQDFRCPIEQAERYFDALLRAGVETELVRFPGEGHELSRGGQPRHREERFEIILEWLARWL